MSNEINTILYASDLGANTGPAINMAFDLAEKYDARIVFLHVIEPINPDALFWVGTDTWQEIREQTYATAQDMITDRINKLVKEKVPEGKRINTPKVRIVNDYAAKAVLDVTEEENADLIVMGKNRHSALGEFLLGSVADKVARLSKIPLMLVPIKEE